MVEIVCSGVVLCLVDSGFSGFKEEFRVKYKLSSISARLA